MPTLPIEINIKVHLGCKNSVDIEYAKDTIEVDENVELLIKKGIKSLQDAIIIKGR